MIPTRLHLSAFTLLILALMLAACAPGPQQSSADQSDGTFRIVATTSMIADLVRTIGGDVVVVDGLMGPGIDPHLYKASEGDVLSMAQADLIVYNGLHLEGKMTDVFDQMNARGISTVAVAQQAVPDSLLLQSESFPGTYDPHVWFDVQLWKRCASYVGAMLQEQVPQHAAYLQERTTAYLAEMDALDAFVEERINTIPAEQRILVTSHDAFGYFGEAYGFEVRALQGLSTVTEAGTADVQELAEFVAARKIPALFIESSVSSRGIEAVKAAVASRNFTVEVGGSLYSDALGTPGTPEATYPGTVRHNINTITDALGGSPGPASE